MKNTMTIAKVVLTTSLLFSAPVFAGEEEEPFFEEAHIFFELNNTDGDLGLHAKIDGDPYKRLKLECGNGRKKKLLEVKVKGGLRKQGLTELFFESAEPTFDELTPEEFFERFPEGDCVVKGVTLDGEKVETETSITHLMPAPAVTTVNGLPAAVSCDAEELPEVSEPITIAWAEVTDSHPLLGRTGETIEVINYQVVVEIDESPFHVSVILPPSARSFIVPTEIIALLGDEGIEGEEEEEEGEGEEEEDEEESDNVLKFEVLVREASFNQTAVESCFIVVE